MTIIIFIIICGIGLGMAVGYFLRYEAPKVVHVYEKHHRRKHARQHARH